MASKKIGDYIPARADNPTQVIIDELFGEGYKKQRLKDLKDQSAGKTAKKLLQHSNAGKIEQGLDIGSYLTKLTTLREKLGLRELDRPSHLIRETDPYNIFRRYNQFERISAGSKEFQLLAKQLGKEAEEGLATVSKQFKGLEILRKVERVTGTGGKVYGKEIYLGSAALGFMPLPMTSAKEGLGKNIVQFGRRKTGAYLAGFVSPTNELVEQTFTDIFYKKFNETVQKNIKPGNLGFTINKESPLIIFDLETTGKMVGGKLSTEADQEILQLSALKLEGSTKTKMNLYFTPKGEIYYKEHGLTKKSLKKLGAKPFAESAQKIKSFFEGATLAGYNVGRFDIPVLQAQLEQAGVSLDLKSQGIVDIYDIHKALNPRAGGTLSEAFKHYTGRELQNAHNAAIDVTASAVVLRRQLEVLGTNYKKSLASLGSQGVSEGIETLAKTLSGSSKNQATFESLRKLLDTKIGVSSTGKELSLRNLFAMPKSIRGMSDTALTAAFKGQETILLQNLGEQVPVEFFKRKKVYNEALRVLHQVLKSRTLSVPDDVSFLQLDKAGGLGTKVSPLVAVTEAYKQIRQYHEYLPTVFEQLGRAGLHPLVKPDFLVEEAKNIIVPSKEAGTIYGREFSLRAQKKGAFQYKKASPITESIARRLQKAGARPVPYFMTSQEYLSGNLQLEQEVVKTTPMTPEEFLSSTKKTDKTATTFSRSRYVGSRRPKRYLVLDFKNPKAYEVLMQDSGALKTQMGIETSVSTQYIDQIRRKSPSKKVLAAFEFLTGRSVLDEGKTGMLDISMQEFKNIQKYKEKQKLLSSREKALSKLMYIPVYDKKSGKYVYKRSKDFGLFRLIASGELPGTGQYGGSVLASPSYKNGILTINLFSMQPEAAISEGVVAGGNRMTEIAARRGNVAEKFLDILEKRRYQGMRGLGVEAVIGKQDLKKMSSLDVFLENFYATVDRYGILNDKNYGQLYKGMLGQPALESITIGGKDYGVATASSKREAAKQALRVIKHLESRGGIHSRIANEAKSGLEVTKATREDLIKAGLKDFEIESARIITVPAFRRSDQRLDTNLGKRAKVTIGKLKTMALGSALLGYKTPFEDPVTRDILFQQKMFGWDAKTKDFFVTKKHPISQFITALADPASVEERIQSGRISKEKQVITVGEDGEFYLGNKKLKKLPSIKEFSVKAGGVSRAELKGTILDPDIADFLYLDLGKERKLTLLGLEKDTQKPILGKLKHRYLPIPKQLLRTEGTVDARVVIGKTHEESYALLKALEAISNRGTASKIGTRALKNIQESIQVIFDKIMGKEGYLAKSHIVHLSSGFGARLIPQQETIHGLADLEDAFKLFEGAASRKQVITALTRREGEFLGRGATAKSSEDYIKLLKQATYGDFMYMTLTADPTQRPEHTSLVKIRLLDKEEDLSIMTYQKNKGTFKMSPKSQRVNIGEYGIDLQLNPSMFKVTSRDTDNDRAVINMLAGDSRALEDRIARQAKAIEPALKFFREGTKKAATQAEKETIVDIFGSYLGQKSFAALGYSQARPTIERLIPVLMSAAFEGPKGYLDLESRFPTMKLTESELTGIGKLFGSTIKEAEEKYAANVALAGYLYQTGVDKGIAKTTQEELNIGLVGIAQSSRAKTLSIEEALKRSYSLFYKFLGAQKENRIYGAGFILQNTSTPKVLEGLIQGAKDSEEFLRGKAAALLASTVGLSYALSDKIGNAYTVGAIAEDESMFYNAKSVYKRIITPLTGIKMEEEVPKSSGLGKKTGPKVQPGKGPKVKKATVPPPKNFAERMSSIKKDILDSFESLRKSKYFAPIVLGTLAMAGIGIINRLTAPDLTPKEDQPDYEGPDVRNFTASLPPPLELSRPMDMGPSLPSMRAPARIHTSSYTPSAGRYKYNQKFGSVSSDIFRHKSSSRLIIDDNTSSRNNSWLIRRQMDMESESDFAY